jgi:prepilin-type N-terminal cleavage/methylation domain-containing protein
VKVFRFALGFSLIELMVVIAIVGVLAGVAIPAYKAYSIKSKVSSAMVTLQYFRNEVEKYYTARNTYPTNVGALGYANGGSINPSNGYGTAALNSGVVTEAGLYNGACATVNSVTVGPCVWVGINQSVIQTSVPGFLGFYLTESGGSLKWSCYTIPANPIPTQYLPTGCIVAS